MNTRRLCALLLLVLAALLLAAPAVQGSAAASQELPGYSASDDDSELMGDLELQDTDSEDASDDDDEGQEAETSSAVASQSADEDEDENQDTDGDADSSNAQQTTEESEEAEDEDSDADVQSWTSDPEDGDSDNGEDDEDDEDHEDKQEDNEIEDQQEDSEVEDDSGDVLVQADDDEDDSDSDSDDRTNFRLLPWVPSKPIGCRNSMSNPQVCGLNGQFYRYRHRRAVWRNGKWYKNAKSNRVWRRGRWSRSRRVRHPRDPRMRRFGGRWQLRPANVIKNYVHVKGLWWKDSKMHQYWWNARWHRPVWRRRANNPRYKRRGNQFVYRRNPKKYVLWEGIWKRRADGKMGYWHGRWRPIGKIVRNNPNFRHGPNGQWINRSLIRPTRYVSKWGLWFRSPRSKRVYRRGRWIRYNHLHRNNPSYRFINNRWQRIAGSPRYKFANGVYWRNNMVFYHGRWMLYQEYRHKKRVAEQMRQIHRGGKTSDIRAAVKAQVQTNFARFIKWFVSNYLRGGNDLKQQFLKPDTPALFNDRFNPEPLPRRKERNPFADTPSAPGDVASWLVDGRVRPLGRRYGNGNRRGSGSPLGATIPAFLEVGDESQQHQQAKQHIAVEDKAAASVDNVESSEVGNGSIISADPTLPSALNGGNMDVKATSDPSLAPETL